MVWYIRSLFFRDVYSPDSNDSGIMSDDRSRACRRRARGNCAAGSDLTPEIAEGTGETERREANDEPSAECDDQTVAVR